MPNLGLLRALARSYNLTVPWMAIGRTHYSRGLRRITRYRNGWPTPHGPGHRRDQPAAVGQTPKHPRPHRGHNPVGARPNRHARTGCGTMPRPGALLGDGQGVSPTP